MTTVTRDVRFERGGLGKRGVSGSPKRTGEPVGRIPRVARLMALAIRFDKLIQNGVVTDQSEMARLARVTQPRMTQIMNLLHLAPDIQEKVLHLPRVMDGRDPITERHMRQIANHIGWISQRVAWDGIRTQLHSHERTS